MKRQRIGRILGTVAFLCLGLLLFGRISEVLRAKTNNEVDMVHSFYELEEDSIDVLCVGSSHAYFSFCPNELWKEQGITSYVMSSNQQTATLSYWLLREALQYQKPKVVVMETYYLFYSGKHTGTARVRQAFDGVLMSPLKKEALDDILKPTGFKDRLSYYIPFLKYHSRWAELTDADFNPAPWLKGQYVSFLHVEENGHTDPEKVYEVPAVSLEYLNRIIDLCEENGIELVLYSAPYGYAGEVDQRYLQKQGVNLFLEDYAAERGIPFLYLQKEESLGIDYVEDFWDVMHVNTNGGRKISHYLGEYLMEHYDLEDHRGDPVYASWEEDYQKYVTYTQEKQAEAEAG